MQTLRQALISFFFLVVFPLFVFAQTSIDNGLIAHWHFDACDLQDSGPNGFNAGVRIGDPMCVQGAQGMAFEFDGVDDFIRIPDVPVEPTQHSYALWFRPATELTSSSPRQDLLYADVDIDIILQTLGRPHITLNHDGEGKLGFHPHIIPDDGGAPFAPDDIQSDTDTWQANRWYHAAFTWDGATFRTYIDGELQQRIDKAPGLSNVYQGLVLAVRGDKQFFFSGSLDEVRIYGRVLTQSEVRELAVPDPAVLTVMAEGSGTGLITSAPQGIDCGSDCSEPYDLGAMVTLTATPDANSVFSGWQGGGCAGETPTCDVQMDQDHAVTATFEPRQVTLQVAANGSGSGAVSSNPAGVDCGADCSELYDVGAMVTLTATPDANSVFSGWQGGGCAGMGDCIVTMNADITVEATFERVFNLSVTKTLVRAADGVVTSSPGGIDCGGACAQSFLNGAMVTLTAAPNANSTFAGWQGNGCAGETPTCIVQMDQDRAVTATFAPVQVALQVAKNGSGSGIVSSNPAGVDCGADCSELYDSGAVVTLTATPDADARFVGWNRDDCPGEGPCAVVLTSAITMTATFENPPPVASAGDDQTVDEGVEVTLDASNSTDFNAAIARYQWRQLSGPTVVLSDEMAAQTTFTAPAAPQNGAKLEFQLEVVDRRGLSATDRILITVLDTNIPPLANAGPDQTVEAGALVTLNGSASSDMDGDLADTIWMQTAGAAVTLSDPTALQPTFTAPALVGEMLQFKLTVIDDDGLSDTDSVSIDIIAAGERDEDADGVADDVEDGAPNSGDGNGDGVPDRQQAHVASLPNQATGAYVTLVAPAHTALVNVRAMSNPSPDNAPANIDFPIGFLEFVVRGLAPSEAAAVTLLLPPDVTPAFYYKFGATADEPTPHWYEFDFDGATGAELANDQAQLHFIDGGRGDDDLTANGEVFDPGAVAVAIQGNGGGDSGGGGGCALSPDAPRDFTSLLLLATLIGYLAWRRRAAPPHA